MTLGNFVNKKLASADKAAEAEGYPLTMKTCKKYKPMRDLRIYGNSVQDGTPAPDSPIDVQSVGELVTDETDVNYGKYKIPVTVRGKNMVKDAREVFKNFADYTELEEDGRQCVRFQSNNYTVYNLEFKENTQYTFSCWSKCVKKPGYGTNYPSEDVILCIRYTDGSYSYLFNASDSVWRYCTYASAANKTIASIGSNSFHWTTYIYVDINNFQIEEGTTVTEYEPYIEPVTTNICLDEPLRKIGEYADFVDFKNNKVVRKVFKHSLKPTSTTPTIPVTAWCRTGHCAFQFSNYLKTLSIQGYSFYSNAFKSGNWTWSGNTFPGNYIYAGHNEVNVHGIIQNECLDGISDDSTNSEKTEALKSFFTNNEIYVICVRKTPTEEPLNIELPKLTAKTSIIEVDTGLLPSNAYGKYIKK